MLIKKIINRTKEIFLTYFFIFCLSLIFSIVKGIPLYVSFVIVCFYFVILLTILISFLKSFF